eukprot:516407-Rhodomonas_salina.1
MNLRCLTSARIHPLQRTAVGHRATAKYPSWIIDRPPSNHAKHTTKSSNPSTIKTTKPTNKMRCQRHPRPLTSRAFLRAIHRSHTRQTASLGRTPSPPSGELLLLRAATTTGATSSPSSSSSTSTRRGRVSDWGGPRRGGHGRRSLRRARLCAASSRSIPEALPAGSAPRVVGHQVRGRREGGRGCEHGCWWDC